MPVTSLTVKYNAFERIVDFDYINTHYTYWLTECNIRLNKNITMTQVWNYIMNNENTKTNHAIQNMADEDNCNSIETAVEMACLYQIEFAVDDI